MSLFGAKTNAGENSRLLGLRVSTSIYGSVVPLARGRVRLPGNLIWIGDWNSTPVKTGGKGGGKGSGGGKGGGGQNTYSESFIHAIVNGSASLVRVFQDKATLGTLPAFSGGAQGQSVWGFLTSKHPGGEALGYSEVAHADYPNYDLGTAGTIPNLTYEIDAGGAFGSGVVDELVSDTVTFLLTNRNAGGLDAGLLGDITQVRNYCLANGLFISPELDQQQPLAEYLREYLMIGNFEIVSSEGLLKFCTYGDTAASSAYGTFVPATAPLYDLDYSDFLANEGETPITFSIEPAQDADNQISIEWVNRDRDYNVESLPDEDHDAVRKYGPHMASAISAHSIKLRSVAAKVASVQIKRRVHMLRKAAFRLPWKYSLLEPMDIVSVPEQYPSTARVAVRLLTIEEDDDGALSCSAEVLPYPISAPTVHPKQSGGGYSPGYGDDPGTTNAPIFVEATPEMQSERLVNSLTLLIALSGGPGWGGSSIYVSRDGGSSYQFVDRHSSRSNMGQLTADLAYGADPDTLHTLSVNLQSSQGTLSSVSQAEADALRSLIAVDQEIMSYRTATLTGSNAYDLTYLRRAAHSSVASIHRTGAPFVAIDGNQYEFPFQVGDIGKTLWFKFPAYNRATQREQDLAACVAYPFTLTAPGTRRPLPLKPWAQFSKLPPFAPAQFVLGLTQKGSTLDISAIPPANQFSPNLTAPLIDATAVVTSYVGGTLIPGSWIAAVCALDSNGIYSPMSNFTEFVVTTAAQLASFGVTLPTGTSQYEVFVGKDIDSLISQGRIGGTTSTIALSTIKTGTPNGYGPPDPRFDHFRVRAKRVIHAGIFTANVSSKTSSTITIGLPAGSSLVASSLIGYTLTLVRTGQNFAITGNTTGGTINLLPTTSFAVGDLVIVRALADTHTATTIGCSLFANVFYPAGMATDDEKNYVVRLTGGTGAGQVRNVASNTATVAIVDQAFAPVPDGTTIFSIEERNWPVDDVTTPILVPTIPASNAAPPVIATIAVDSLEGYFALIEVLTQDAQGNDSIESLDGICDFYVVRQSAPTGEYTIIPDGSGNCLVELLNGDTQYIQMGASTLTVTAPSFYGGAINPGQRLTLNFLQDATGGRAVRNFSGGVGGFVSNTGDSITFDPTASTETTVVFEFRSTGFWSIISQQTAKAIT